MCAVFWTYDTHHTRVTCDTFVCAMVGPAESVDAVASVVLNVSTLNVWSCVHVVAMRGSGGR